jgi:uncharacterized protein (DUF488 family)
MTGAEGPILYTIGHSNHAIEKFVELLQWHGVTAVADVRSAPYSKYAPQFNSEPLAAYLKRQGIDYVFLGKELGARPQNPSCYVAGRVDFVKLAATPLFKAGVERLRQILQTSTLALMCTEKDPAMCHRTILVCRNLRGRGWAIRHILADGTLEEHEDIERRLVALTKVEPSLFDPDASLEHLADQAYDQQARSIAMSAAESEPGE